MITLKCKHCGCSLNREPGVGLVDAKRSAAMIDTCPGSEWNCKPFTCPYVTSLDKPCGRPPERLGADHCDLHSVLSAIDSLDSVDDLFELLEGLKK